MTEPVNIGSPRDTMAAEDCEVGLKLLFMNQPGWPTPESDVGRPNGEYCARKWVVWPTLKSYQWMRQFEDNNHARNRNGITSKVPPCDRA